MALAIDGDLAAVRALVRREAARAGLALAGAENLLLATNEVVTNSLLHAGAPGELRIWTDGGEVICEVTDGGWIHDPLAGRVAPGSDQPGGRGLWLANQLCDLVELRSARPAPSSASTSTWRELPMCAEVSYDSPTRGERGRPVSAGDAARTTPIVEVSRSAPNVAVVCLLGEHDLASEAEVTGVIARELGQGSDVVIDLSETLFIDSRIIAALLKESAHAEELGRGLVLLIGPDSPARRVLEITRVDRHLRPHATIDSAVEALAARP